jgi:hypothetical protein
MYAPWVTWHTSVQYSSSCHTRVSMGASIFTAAMIHAFRSARSHGNCGMNTQLLIYQTMEKTGPNPFSVILAVNGRPHDFCLHRHTVSVNCLYHAQMDHVCRRVLCVLCMKCTLHSNHRLTPVIFRNTNRLLPWSGHFLTT